MHLRYVRRQHTTQSREDVGHAVTVNPLPTYLDGLTKGKGKATALPTPFPRPEGASIR